MSELDAYRRKRRRDRTPEPFDGPAPCAGSSPIFVVQRHEARRLHYDFRLERGGALASWAVPKGIPLEVGVRSLAVHVEDHPLAYASFAGEIPEGQYGAGSVEIWDRGTYELVEEKRDGQLTVRLRGERLSGTWTLVPAHLDGKEENWLLVRRSDASAPGTGRAGSYRPMLACPTATVPTGDGWLFEVKFDGYRALAVLESGGCRLLSRNDNDLSGRFPGIAAGLARQVPVDATVVDGEVCSLDHSGRPSFSAMQQGGAQTVYYAFDLLEEAGVSLVDLPLEERRRRLAALLEGREGPARLSDSFDDGPALLAAVEAQGLEGILAKRRGSRYAPGKRSRDWLKLKIHGRQELVVAGYTRGDGARAATFGALVLAVREDASLRWVGNVGTGFDDRELRRVAGLLRSLERPEAPFSPAPRMPRLRRGDVVWVEPVLVAEVEFSEWTHDGKVRHPVYRGLRDDKPAAAVRRESPPASGPAAATGEEVVRSGRRELPLTNRGKPFWPEEGITKGDLLDYYRAIAPMLVPHLRDRPFTMRRYPDGASGKVFFQKDAPAHMPDWIPRYRALVSTRADGRERKWVDFPVVNDELALLWMVNMGCIDMNPWTSRRDRPDRPDVVLFDLDPTPEVSWARTIEVALLLRGLLDGLGLASFPKTSGGKGFHILVPLDRRSTYEDTRRFAELVAGVVAAAHPRLATTVWAKARRRGVLIDANQNGMGKTIASVYSVRPHPGAPVSTPLRWDEVVGVLDPRAFTMAAVLDRVDRLGDLHAGVLSTRQSLSKALARL